PRALELVERRDQRLRHVAPAVLAEALGNGLPVHAATCVASTARKNAMTLSGSLTPGDASVPLAVSTPHGWTARMPSPTFSGVKPPDSTSGTFERRLRSSFQSNDSPVPPYRSGWCASTRWKSTPRNAFSACRDAASFTRAAFMTFAPVRRATSLQ